MDLIGAGFGHEADAGAGMFPKGNVVQPSLNFELLNRIGARDRNSAARDVAGLKIGDRNTIEFVAVVIGARSVDENPIVAGVDLGQPAAAGPQLCSVVDTGQYAWRQVDNLSEIS